MIPLRDNIPSQRLPWMNYLIILACVLGFLYQLSLPHLGDTHAFRPEMVLTQKGLSEGLGTIFLAALATMFMHGGLFHLVSNMWFLWIFGDNVEDRMGHFPYLLFYLLCGFLATGAHVLITSLGFDPRGLGIPIVGASGAIAGVLGAYYRLFPRASVRSLIFIVFFVTLADIPAVLFIMIWFILQVVSGVGSIGMGSGVAVWAHVGGFIAGLILVNFFVPRLRPPSPPRVVEAKWE
jgi:membrane associated rhomboid family serine protease